MIESDFKRVKSFNSEHSLNLNIEYRLLDIISELGELAKEILSSSQYGKSNCEVNDKLKDELGDLYYSILSCFDNLDLLPDQILGKTLEKYRIRYITKKNISSSSS